MTGVTIKNVAELGYYQGPHAVAGIRFRYAGRELGVSAWGMNVIDMDPHCEQYPDHDHLGDGQEEVYVVLEGAVTLHSGGEALLLERGAMVRVGCETKRKFTTGDVGGKLLALGATPGKAYSVK